MHADATLVSLVRLAVFVAMASAPSLAADDERDPPLPATSEAIQREEPLVVTIRPSYQDLTDGYVEDAIVETSDGQYFIYSGWYVGDIGNGLSLRREIGRSVPTPLFDLGAHGPANASVGDVNLRRYGLARDAVGLQLGPRYKNMSFDEISLSFGRDPTPRVAHFASAGIYGRRDLFAPYDLADQVLGKVSFGSASGGKPPLGPGVLLAELIDRLKE